MQINDNKIKNIDDFLCINLSNPCCFSYFFVFPRLPWAGTGQYPLYCPWPCWDWLYTHHSTTSMLVKFFRASPPNPHQDTHWPHSCCVPVHSVPSLRLDVTEASALCYHCMCLTSCWNTGVSLYSSLKWEMTPVPLTTMCDTTVT